LSLDSTSHDHDGVVEGTLSLIDVLIGTSSEDEGARLGPGAAGEEVVSLRAKLNFLKLATSTENIVGQSVDSGLDNTAGGLGKTSKVVAGNSTSAEEVSISEVLGGEVANGQAGQDNVGTAGDDLIELLIDQFPLSIDDLLEVVGILEADLGVLSLRLELKLDVEEDDLRVLELLWLLLEARVGEGLSESNTLNEEGVCDRATSDLFNADKTLVEVTLEVLDCLDDHISEELLIVGDDFGVEGGLSALFEDITAAFDRVVSDLDGDLLDVLD
jgi:hypothetical protein